MLVRVNPDALIVDDEKPLLDNHGYLWLLVEEIKDDNLHRYKSLATGYEYMWFDHEVERDDG